jgi:hypothetical protein
MGILKHIRVLACASLLALAACANGVAFGADGGAASGTKTGCFFCNAPVRYVHGYFSSRGPMPRDTTFVHKGETVFVDGPASVVAYDGITVAYAQARVSAYENATVYYYDRAFVSTSPGYSNNVRLFFCPGPSNAAFNPKSCHLVQHR